MLCAPLVRGAGAIAVDSSEHAYVFSQSLTFRLAAHADAPITKAILFYGREGGPLFRRIYPDFESGAQVRIEHVETLERGQYAPGTRLSYWWELVAQDGARAVTHAQVFEYTDTGQIWQTLPGQRIDILWYGSEEAKAKTLLGKGDEAVARLERDIGVPLEARVRVYVYNSARDMSKALSQRSSGYDERVTTLGVSVDEHTLLLLGNHRDANETIAHELSHIVVGLATDNPYNDLPRWLDEGLAMYAEGVLPSGNKRALEQGIRNNDLFSVRSMSSYTGQASKVDLFYGQAYSVVDYMLREYGRDKVRALLAVFSKGARQEDALQRVYGFGLDDLDARWRSSLGLAPRVRTTPTPGKSLLDRILPGLVGSRATGLGLWERGLAPSGAG